MVTGQWMTVGTVLSDHGAITSRHVQYRGAIMHRSVSRRVRVCVCAVQLVSVADGGGGSALGRPINRQMSLARHAQCVCTAASLTHSLTGRHVLCPHCSATVLYCTVGVHTLHIGLAGSTSAHRLVDRPSQLASLSTTFICTSCDAD